MQLRARACLSNSCLSSSLAPVLACLFFYYLGFSCVKVRVYISAADSILNFIILMNLRTVRSYLYNLDRVASAAPAAWLIA